jgi:hypothetical protein
MFGILAATPAVANSGPSDVTGDVGIWPASAITGFPPGTLTGTEYAGDAVAQTAQGDLTTAYNFAAAARRGHSHGGYRRPDSRSWRLQDDERSTFAGNHGEPYAQRQRSLHLPDRLHLRLRLRTTAMSFSAAAPRPTTCSGRLAVQRRSELPQPSQEPSWLRQPSRLTRAQP